MLRRHPWIFSGAIAKINGHPEPGETVEVCDSTGRFVARGAYSPDSLGYETDEAIEAGGGGSGGGGNDLNKMFADSDGSFFGSAVSLRR